MTEPQTDNATGYLPWLAVAGAWFAFGSFAVPMKWKSVVDAEVNPLVYQCYKTFWTFVTSHLVLFFQPYEFTWWGILSGFSWVPAGVAAVIAVQNVGIAYGQAIWQVTIIMTSCVWGFAIFRDEEVKSWWGTGAALACLVVGVVGMTISFNMYKADPDDAALSHVFASQAQNVIADEARNSAPATPSNQAETKPVPENDLERSVTLERSVNSNPARSATENTMRAGLLSRSGLISVHSNVSVISGPRRQTRSTLSDVRYAADDLAPSVAGRKASVALGIGAALFNGTWGGSNLVPSKYAPLHGVHFVISFAYGALIANVTLVLVYILWVKAFTGGPLPSPQFRVMALPGFLSGTMWSAGNFCSLYVVNSIGQGIGYSLVQSSVICAGLWGILLYREMTGRPLIYWSFFCAVCIGGVGLLAFERK